jgi:hypothetical protein
MLRRLVIKTEFFFQSAGGADGMVHAKSIGSQEIRPLLVARKQLLGRVLDLELSIRGILRGFGLKVGQVTRRTLKRGFGNW